VDNGMTILVTGAAGFIGFHTAATLLDRGDGVIGVDNLNDYYDVTLKRARLAQLEKRRGFSFHKADVADHEAMGAIFAGHPDITTIVHLAAQAGVRYSLENPFAYIQANVAGQLVLLENARRLDRLEHMVYASSSSVYGGNTKLPFSVADRVDTPVSMYAATKRMDELMGHTYAHLYGLPQTGLRFFTVYGPWGRPDMAAYLFADAILAGRPIRVFNYGDMRRDFTFIDDIVAGVLAAVGKVPDGADGAPHRVYNLGNHRSEKLTDFIATLERALGREAIKQYEPLQPGDVRETYADIEDSRADLGFEPKTTIEEGIPKFVDWFRAYHGWTADTAADRA
jgi:UDP-glucuronate 4-epimerase